ncbi:tRNA dihydrouridine synthase [Vogesella indigofera]|uniref:tRNA dihydrouridine synthase n=1 Tax=Vogesella indigofera TaxID=45465 RepID=UPI00234EA953|nr:tRNA-dihydrouridine synthase [Vogesella indigofera]MDC7706744.1 tRNA-dihydrouridine synthase [Vogesella indigofera]
MKIVLAPMEGLVDDVMRDVLTEIGGIDWCVTEFIRVTNSLLPVKTFHRLAPELLQQSKTRAGTPVRLQLLGSDPVCLADNAARAAELGAPVIDLNFGCPAPTVNRHRGGAVLLKEPQTLYEIITAVRAAVPADIPVTAKMRLGYEDTSLTLDCARAINAAGAAELTVHARTKVEGYKPPAHWEWFARIKEVIDIPLIANGEVWTLEDYCNIRAVSQCETIMIGRGLIAAPDFAKRIKHLQQTGSQLPPKPWTEVLAHVDNLFMQCQLRAGDSSYAVSRVKQWLNQLKRTYIEAGDFFNEIRSVREPEQLKTRLHATR